MSMYKLLFCLVVCAFTYTQLISKRPVNYKLTNKYFNELPTSLANKPVHYLHVDQIRNWSCGYNALYNACRIEQRIGLPNKNVQLEHFNAICLDYAFRYDRGPTSSSSNKTLTELAPQLGLQKLTCLGMDDNNSIRPLGLHVSYGFWYQDSYQTQEHKKQKAIEKKSKAHVTKLVQDFDATQGPACVHFICNIDTTQGKHWVLVSVTKNNIGEQQLYVCDNMNGPITKYSQMEKYIHYLCDLFNVSKAHNASITRQPTLLAPAHSMQPELSTQQKAALYRLLAQYKVYTERMHI